LPRTTATGLAPIQERDKKNMSNIEDIASALAFLNDAQKELEEAANKGYSTPSWACAKEYERVDRAREALREALNEYIDDRVKEVLLSAKEALDASGNYYEKP
jgi:chromosome segregation ATPase